MIPCDDCGRPVGDHAVPLIDSASLITGYVCRHCATDPPTLCDWGDCTDVATSDEGAAPYCDTHAAQERHLRAREKAHYLQGGTTWPT